MNIYTMTKNTISRQKKAGKLNKEQWQNKLDVFLAFDNDDAGTELAFSFGR